MVYRSVGRRLTSLVGWGEEEEGSRGPGVSAGRVPSLHRPLLLTFALAEKPPGLRSHAVKQLASLFNSF